MSLQSTDTCAIRKILMDIFWQHYWCDQKWCWYWLRNDWIQDHTYHAVLWGEVVYIFLHSRLVQPCRVQSVTCSATVQSSGIWKVQGTRRHASVAVDSRNQARRRHEACDHASWRYCFLCAVVKVSLAMCVATWLYCFLWLRQVDEGLVFF